MITNPNAPKKIDPIKESFFVVDKNGQIVYKNPKFAQFFNQKKEITNISDIFDVFEKKSP
ncbi:MAG: hypothetical protein HC932_06500 [Thermales bacterium]|nr:hypothetical protein [Thermales bacterium]